MQANKQKHFGEKGVLCAKGLINLTPGLKHKKNKEIRHREPLKRGVAIYSNTDFLDSHVRPYGLPRYDGIT